METDQSPLNCGGGSRRYNFPFGPFSSVLKGDPVESGTYALFDTSEGSFTIRLFEKEAPKTVANFVGLAEGTKEWKDPSTGQKQTGPYYNGIIFHRVIEG